MHRRTWILSARADVKLKINKSRRSCCIWLLLLFMYFETFLISERFSDKQHLNPANNAAAPCNHRLAANTVVAKAVPALSSSRAWCLFVQPDAVWRRSKIAYPLDGVFHSRRDFVHAGNDNYLVRPIDQCGNPVAVAVDIDKVSIERNRVCTHKISICTERIPVCLLDFLRCFCHAAVNQAEIRSAF